jgi:hypothetical protein
LAATTFFAGALAATTFFAGALATVFLTTGATFFTGSAVFFVIPAIAISFVEIDVDTESRT